MTFILKNGVMGSKDGIEYSSDNTILISVTEKESIVIRSDVTTIYGQSENDYAFKDSAQTLTSFSFESNPRLKVISPFAFFQCTELKSVDLSSCNNLTTIGEKAFYKCTSCTSLKLPNSIERLCLNCFEYSKISSVFFPASLTTIESSAFASTSLTEVTFDKNVKIKDLFWRSFGSLNLPNFCVPASVESIAASAFS